MDIQEKVREIIRKHAHTYEWGGDEDSEGNLQNGPVSFEELEKEVMEALQLPQTPTEHPKGPATVGILMGWLSQFPGDTPMSETRYSGYGRMNMRDWGTESLVNKVSGRDGWMDVARTDEEKARAKLHVHFYGN
jgi:hypothetical protein